MRPAVDQATGSARDVVRAAMGPSEYDSIGDAIATEAVEYTITPLQEPELHEQQSTAVRGLITERMREMSPKDYSETLRSAIREDEWLLIAHGAVLGFVVGGLHIVAFGV